MLVSEKGKHWRQKAENIPVTFIAPCVGWHLESINTYYLPEDGKGTRTEY